jgi:hypothetical protein
VHKVRGGGTHRARRARSLSQVRTHKFTSSTSSIRRFSRRALGITLSADGSARRRAAHGSQSSCAILTSPHLFSCRCPCPCATLRRRRA